MMLMLFGNRVSMNTAVKKIAQEAKKGIQYLKLMKTKHIVKNDMEKNANWEIIKVGTFKFEEVVASEVWI